MKSEIYILAATTLLFVGSNAGLLKYPNESSPCILVELSGNLSLTLKPSDGSQQLKAGGSLDGATLAGTGHCTDSQNTAAVDLLLNGLSGTFSLEFSKRTDSKVLMNVKYTFIPSVVFKNNDSKPIIMEDEGDTVLSKDTASYTCSEIKQLSFKQMGQYELKLSLGKVQIQAFNVDKVFSAAEDCSTLDAVSTEGPTTMPPAPTTVPAGPTTEPPPGQTTVQATTQPQNGTSEATTKMATSEGPKTSMAPSNMSTENPTTQAPTSEAPTTTPMAPTTSEPPTPAPGSPTVQTYMAKYTNGSTCVMLKAGIEFKIPYNNTKKELTSKVIGIPMNITSVTGNCAGPNGTQNLEITFYNDWKVRMVFREDADNTYLSNLDLTVNVNKELIPDAEPYSMTISQKLDSGTFSASKSGSYKCNGDSKVGLTNGFEMDTYNLQYSAFQSNITAFPTDGITECAGDSSTNSVVPIAVGAALAGLVVIVLIAYLIGRKRSRQTGYEQV